MHLERGVPADVGSALQTGNHHRLLCQDEWEIIPHHPSGQVRLTSVIIKTEPERKHTVLQGNHAAAIRLHHKSSLWKFIHEHSFSTAMSHHTRLNTCNPKVNTSAHASNPKAHHRSRKQPQSTPSLTQIAPKQTIAHTNSPKANHCSRKQPQSKPLLTQATPNQTIAHTNRSYSATAQALKQSCFWKRKWS